MLEFLPPVHVDPARIADMRRSGELFCLDAIRFTGSGLASVLVTANQAYFLGGYLRALIRDSCSGRKSTGPRRSRGR